MPDNADNASRIERMRERLAVLHPEAIEIHDESHRHVGHAGAQDGRGHFTCTIVSRAFEGKSVLDCHRMVYDALGDMMLHDIHALSIRALVPDKLASDKLDPEQVDRNPIDKR